MISWKGTLSAWRPGARAMACLLFAAGAAAAYDLTPDRGAMSYNLGQDNGYVLFYVWNVGSNDWGPVNNCSTIWANGQWRDEAGKRIGSVASKTVVYQTDFNPLTNGWFTPNPQRSSGGDCHGSLISRGWDDEYGNPMPSTAVLSHAIKPTLHEKLDPAGLNGSDENLDNNEVWITTQWDAATSMFKPLENMYLPFGTTTLTSGDSLFYGVYSTNSANGNIYVDYISRTTNLTHGNEKVGYAGRRMIVNLSGGQSNTYTIQNGSKVRADLLGQNKYGSFTPP
jgi:hypothetical protein